MTSRQFLYIAIATFITAAVLVTLNIAHSNSQVQIPPDIKQLMEPISPNFDREVINAL